MNTQNIEGLPNHLEVVAFRVPEYGEYYLDNDGKVANAKEGLFIVRAIVAAKNVYLTMDLNSVKIPAGYELAGKTQDEWFREPRVGEDFLGSWGFSVLNREDAQFDFETGDSRRLILRRIAPKTKKFLIVETDAPDVIKYFEKGCDLTLSAPAACAFAGVKNARVEVREVK